MLGIPYVKGLSLDIVQDLPDSKAGSGQEIILDDLLGPFQCSDSMVNMKNIGVQGETEFPRMMETHHTL